MRSLAFAFAAALALVGCGTKEDASLFVYAKNVTLVKGTNSFGSKLDGSVDVVFDLGKWSQGSVSIEAIQLGIYRDNKQLVEGATITPQGGTSFPVELAPNQTHSIKYTIVKATLTPDETTALCAGPVQVSGTVKQAGKGEIQISGEPTKVDGCP